MSLLSSPSTPSSTFLLPSFITLLPTIYHEIKLTITQMSDTLSFLVSHVSTIFTYPNTNICSTFWGTNQWGEGSGVMYQSISIITTWYTCIPGRLGTELNYSTTDNGLTTLITSNNDLMLQYHVSIKFQINSPEYEINFISHFNL